MKPLLLRLHRWITLLFAVPLAVLIVTGLVLSFEPIAQDRLFTGRSIDPGAVAAALARHDPERKAAALNIRAYENAIILGGRGVPATRVDLATNTKADAGIRTWSDTFATARRLHETLLLDLSWLVTAATIAMLVAMGFGLLMGLPFFRNSLGGWHRATAWLLSPLLILAPLTGLALVFGITFAQPSPRIEGPPVALHDAVAIVAAKHDLASVYWIRPQGGAMRARIYDGRQAKVFAVTPAGLVAGPQSWPRALHEGVWAGAYSGLLNVVISLALLALMATGMTIWVRRTFRRARPQRGAAAA